MGRQNDRWWLIVILLPSHDVTLLAPNPTDNIGQSECVQINLLRRKLDFNSFLRQTLGSFPYFDDFLNISLTGCISSPKPCAFIKVLTVF